MEQYRIATQNAFGLYLQDPTVERAREIVRSTTAWPLMERGRHVAMFMGMFDALAACHGDDFMKLGLLARLGNWFVRRSCPAWRPGWNDYWMVYWQLVEGQHKHLARRAIRELHRRGFHLHPEAGRFRLESETIPPEWSMTQHTALWMLRSQVVQLPGFRAALDFEISGCPDEARHRLELELPRNLPA